MQHGRKPGRLNMVLKLDHCSTHLRIRLHTCLRLKLTEPRHLLPSDTNLHSAHPNRTVTFRTKFRTMKALHLPYRSPARRRTHLRPGHSPEVGRLFDKAHCKSAHNTMQLRPDRRLAVARSGTVPMRCPASARPGKVQTSLSGSPRFHYQMATTRDNFVRSQPTQDPRSAKRRPWPRACRSPAQTNRTKPRTQPLLQFHLHQRRLTHTFPIPMPATFRMASTPSVQTRPIRSRARRRLSALLSIQSLILTIHSRALPSVTEAMGDSSDL